MAGSFSVRRGPASVVAALLASIFFGLASSAVWAQQVDIGSPRTVVDTDGLPGETVVLDGSRSQPTHGGSITSYVWTYAQGQPAAPAYGANVPVRLPDGVTWVTLTVKEVVIGEGPEEGEHIQSTTVAITVGEAAPQQAL